MSGEGNSMNLMKDKQIRIITVSNIRYEGKLYQISQKDKTIVLKDVVSYGTEDRNTDNVIPPSQNVHEIMQFKASHIQDLKVLTDEQASKSQVVKADGDQPPKTYETKAPEIDHEREKNNNKQQYAPEKDYYESSNYEPKKYDNNRNDYYKPSQRGNRGGAYRKTNNPREKTDFEPKEFDFDEMEQKFKIFEKEKEEKEEKEDNSVKKDVDDFFDVISSSINEKGESKDQYHSYKTNQETFGPMKRGGFRGGRNNYRGRGRGGYNRNNDNRNDEDNNRGYGSSRGGYNNNRGGYNNNNNNRGSRGGYRSNKPRYQDEYEVKYEKKSD